MSNLYNIIINRSKRLNGKLREKSGIQFTINLFSDRKNFSVRINGKDYDSLNDLNKIKSILKIEG